MFSSTSERLFGHFGCPKRSLLALNPTNIERFCMKIKTGTILNPKLGYFKIEFLTISMFGTRVVSQRKCFFPRSPCYFDVCYPYKKKKFAFHTYFQTKWQLSGHLMERYTVSAEMRKKYCRLLCEVEWSCEEFPL